MHDRSVKEVEKDSARKKKVTICTFGMKEISLSSKILDAYSEPQYDSRL